MRDLDGGGAQHNGEITKMRKNEAVWRVGLICLCAVAFVVPVAVFFDSVGAGGRPWFGYWDANATASGRPYTLAIAQPRPGGASAAAGLRDGDLIDLREQSLTSRVAAAYQPPATRATTLRIRRNGVALTINVTGSTSWEGAPAWKLPAELDRTLTALFFAVCALLIALRRQTDRDARMLSLILLCLGLIIVEPQEFVIPDSRVSLVLLVVARAAEAAAALLLVRLASLFGSRSKTRSILECISYAAALSGFATDVSCAIGLATLWLDPVPLIARISPLRGWLDATVWLLVSVCAFVAVYSTHEDRRPRTAWLLLPLPVAMFGSAVVITMAVIIKSWFANIAVVSASGVILLIGAFIVTYALLKRRVLDLEFVLSRTLVVASVSLIVVAAFVLLEWLLGTVLADVSHATGLVANAGLALALGISLNAIHKRVDLVIDAVLFRKRHDDERALLEFSKEAAYITETGALLNRAIEKIRNHTDTRNAALLLNDGDEYAAARSFGGVPSPANENDAAILALKTWHKPIDPHHYESRLGGALAVPMIARGRLIGVLVLGERTGGESYAPDEVEAISQFAHGVGSALDALSAKNDSNITTLAQALGAMSDSIATLAKETASLRSEIRGQSSLGGSATPAK